MPALAAWPTDWRGIYKACAQQTVFAAHIFVNLLAVLLAVLLILLVLLVLIAVLILVLLLVLVLIAVLVLLLILVLVEIHENVLLIMDCGTAWLVWPIRPISFRICPWA